MSNKDNTPMSVEKQNFLTAVAALFQQNVELVVADPDLSFIVCFLADIGGVMKIEDSLAILKASIVERKGLLADFDDIAAAAWARGEQDDTD